MRSCGGELPEILGVVSLAERLSRFQWLAKSEERLAKFDPPIQCGPFT
jgi:hypothetical protein